MKKKMLNFLLTGILVINIAGCGKKIKYIQDTTHEHTSNYTYRFTGESKHFYFQTGKVNYDSNKKELLISNFKVKDSFDETGIVYKFNVYFNDKGMFGTDAYEKFSKKEFENMIVSEYGTGMVKDEYGRLYGESDAFLETNKNNFKKAIKIEIEYCKSYCKDDEECKIDSNNNCNTETFKINFID